MLRLGRICFHRLKEAFCLVCQGSLEPESTGAAAALFLSRVKPQKCPSTVDGGEGKRPGARNCFHIGLASLVRIAGSVTFGKLLNLSEHSFPHL